MKDLEELKLELRKQECLDEIYELKKKINKKKRDRTFKKISSTGQEVFGHIKNAGRGIEKGIRPYQEEARKHGGLGFFR